MQIRDKYCTSRELYEAAIEVCQVAAEAGVRVIINDRVDVAIAAGAAGVHLGQNDMPPEKVRTIIGSDAIIGFSTHSVEQAKEAIMLPVDYIAIGPIFETSTKEDPDETVGLEGIRAVRDVIGDFPLVAIGGITIENVGSVFSAGADSAAMIGSIVRDAASISRTMRQLRETYDT